MRNIRNICCWTPAIKRPALTCGNFNTNAGTVYFKSVQTKAESSGIELSERVKTMIARRNYRFAFPEFLPDANPLYRNTTRERLERADMLKRRQQVEIPEFYVGSIVAVTLADPNAVKDGKTRFVGIVIDRGGTGLRAWTILRNVIDGQGVEIRYDIYSPNIIHIETLRLEQRLDDELYYLRDAPKAVSYTHLRAHET